MLLLGEDYFYFIPDRLLWERSKEIYRENDKVEECILCDKKDRFLSRKEDLNFA